MGKKGKRDGKSGSKEKKQGPGKARRERAAAVRELEERIAALVEKLEVELEGKDVFSPLAEREDCPICLAPLPLEKSEWTYQSCCGKVLCIACHALNVGHYAVKHEMTGQDGIPCAFCRTLYSGKEDFERTKQRAEERMDTQAMSCIAEGYLEGINFGLPKDEVLAMKWYVRAAEQGHLMSTVAVADMIYRGKVVEKNVVLTKKLATAAAKQGLVNAHNLLGFFYLGEVEKKHSKGEPAVPTMERVLNHWRFAAVAGYRPCMANLEDVSTAPGLISQEELDIIKEEHENAAKMEWTEEREEFRKDGFAKRAKDMAESRRRRTMGTSLP